MDRLWTPWRYRYLAESGPKPGCIFCAKAAEQRDEANYIVHRDAACFVLLNLYPYNNGHLIIAPYEHVASLGAAPAATLTDLMRITRLAESCLASVYNAPGFNIGMNIGECAGAGVAGHIHMHVVPRWPGDANFMSTISETRVLPEELAVTWARLREAFAGERRSE